MIIPVVKNGCRFHNDCFTCPFPDCIEQTGQRPEKMLLVATAESLFKKGYSDADVATVLNKSIRTIRRYRDEVKEVNYGISQSK